MAGELKCCALIFGVVILFTILGFVFDSPKNYTPSCSVKEVYIPALNTKLPTFNSTFPAATFIFFDLQLDNAIKDGIYYEYTNPTLAFYYAGFTIANFTVPKFAQGDEETAHLRDLVETRDFIMPWWDALAAVSGGSTVAFAVEFSVTVKAKRFLEQTGHKELLLRADVEVNDSGEKAKKKNIKLVPFVKSISTNFPTSLQSDDDALIGVYSA